MTDQTKTRFPAPLYAAAGAGDLAYQQLRKLPAVINELSDRAAATLRTANETATSRATTLREKAATTDLDRFRSTAASSAAALAQAAQERAIALYTALVAHGERVVGTGVVEAADVVNADIEATEEPKVIEGAKTAPEPKPRKRTTTTTTTTRPAAK
jgi:heparin binding hemagglutinin HbhA